MRHLVELHGGSARAQSAGKGQGATFTLWLPAGTAPEQAAGRAAQPYRAGEREDSLPGLEAASVLRGTRVLLVDDDSETRPVLGAALAGHGAIVRAAASAAEALAALQSSPADVLVCGVAMPFQDGGTLIHTLRAREVSDGSQTPAVTLTANVKVGDRLRALEAGFNLVVPKPVQLDELIAVVADLAAAAR